MKFFATPIAAAKLVEVERHEDERGYFARTWCREEFHAHGIDVDLLQASVSRNRRRGTLRGMHFAHSPSREAKLVRCSRGRVHDVILDLRPGSPSFLKHFAVTLDADAHNALYIPQGVAHGFQTLEDDCEVTYMMTDIYRPECADGVRYDDASFGIAWPLEVTCIAERDRTYPDYRVESHAARPPLV